MNYMELNSNIYIKIILNKVRKHINLKHRNGKECHDNSRCTFISCRQRYLYDSNVTFFLAVKPYFLGQSEVFAPFTSTSQRVWTTLSQTRVIIFVNGCTVQFQYLDSNPIEFICSVVDMYKQANLNGLFKFKHYSCVISHVITSCSS